MTISLQAKYTGRGPLPKELVSTLPVHGVALVEQRVPTAVNFGFLDLSRYSSFK
jgi:hypothetical protein